MGRNNKASVLDDSRKLKPRHDRLAPAVYRCMAGSQFEHLMNAYQTRPVPIDPSPDLSS